MSVSDVVYFAVLGVYAKTAYNSERPHQALGYLSPQEYRAKEKPPGATTAEQSVRAASLGSEADERERAHAHGEAVMATDTKGIEVV